jgi:nickel-dependent lactate racemase
MSNATPEAQLLARPMGLGHAERPLTEAETRGFIQSAFEHAPVDGKRVLVIIPDGTRTAPIALLYRLLHEAIGSRAAQLDYLIALGTHQPMSEGAIARLVGMDAAERALRTPNSRVFNHAWDDPDALTLAGVITPTEMRELTGGLVERETPVTINRLAFEYDHLLIIGPVFPHEVAGFSGGAKYLFPGISGAEIIDSSHWLGALSTSYATIGVKDTPVRRVLHHAAGFVTSRKPVTCLKLAMKGPQLHGLYTGDHLSAWSAAAELSGELNIRWHERPYSSVLSMPSVIYDDLWTAAKAMYKTEPVVADGGEIIIYAPHLTEISVTHGHLIERVGYHVRDWFLSDWDRFHDIPWTTLAHSTHVKGAGTMVDGIERPRIKVTLATGIPEETCRRVNLGWRDPASIDPEHWRDREHEGRLLVENAGENLYRLRS